MIAGSFAAVAQEKVRIGYVISKTGPNSGGAMTTQVPNYKLWIKELNDRGGLNVAGKRIAIELIEHDDRSSSEEAVRATERLLTQDKVDLMLAPWGTAINLAVAPLYARSERLLITPTAITDRAPELAKRWPLSFWLSGTSASYADALVEQLKRLREAGKIDAGVAMVSVGDGFGIDLAAGFRAAAKKNGFEIKFDKTYPAGTQDFAPIVNEMKAKDVKVFVAFSYPPDTIALTEEAQLLDYNPSVFYIGIGGAFPLYRNRFGSAVEGVMTLGGIDPKSDDAKSYIARHKEVTGQEPDRSGSFTMYAALQALEQVIAEVGLDQKRIATRLKEGTFKTILGEVSFAGQQMTNAPKVGQWQNGELAGLAHDGNSGATEMVFPKPVWRKSN
ncbi:MULTISPECIES: amino acid ABC transporter substrate-binding protein [unclassified Bradyrhizobium]|uniref:amino acid ABC transporter substrate-binding protein n=1 Tax=unclassified Bradyrhizobium TaxID=2631580 RepID=UPI002479B4DE|nr:MULTISPECIES: amino acid ABC transporter substrate-binding protein [unclassified Bradyrhizobium]WGR73122.1 amino acid ABC transporter substrate-binding protein [Bradyrhizobium sp. ISRA426]WGR77962.1 amino acid ABC transporter substrate-binding protein [Bradyrhizobium sp. ISRA430]WGR88363.1 amino acid ABC transporter substrate-binding protein [Bradyrhizobium sp. ISRA432]